MGPVEFSMLATTVTQSGLAFLLRVCERVRGPRVVPGAFL